MVETRLKEKATMKRGSPRKYARCAIKFNDSSLRRTPSSMLSPYLSLDGLFGRTRERVAGVESVVNRSIEMAGTSR